MKNILITEWFSTLRVLISLFTLHACKIIIFSFHFPVWFKIHTYEASTDLLNVNKLDIQANNKSL